MKQLYVLRHAKSSWDDADMADFDRPLAPRGRRACAAIVEALRRCRVAPDLVLCSPAARTRETFELVAAALPGDPVVEIERDLYLASANRLAERLKAVDDAFERVLLIGHNPGLQRLAVALAGSGPAAPLAKLRAKFPTGALACLSLPIERWRDLAPGAGSLNHLATPRPVKAD